MPGLNRRALGAAVAALGAALLATMVPTATAQGARDDVVPPADVPTFTFVSSPDLFNADVGDIRKLGVPLKRGLNSWNRSYATAVDTVFSTLASYQADAYLVAGDMVEGHWAKDVDATGYFGPTRTDRQDRRAITRAGDFYYGRHKSFFRQAGIDPRRVFPAVGDHEIGDNPWPVHKTRTVPTYKRVWADNFTTNYGNGHRFAVRPVGTPFEDTSYATWLTAPGDDGVLLVTVDVFRVAGGVVTPTVRAQHLQWFESVLSAAPAEATVIVQAHTPAIGPVRSVGSSKLFLDGGESNEFWTAMDSSGKVDFYFAGEVHDNTARRTGSTIQVTHGGLFAYNGTSYLVGRVYADRVELDLFDFAVRVDRRAELWATSAKRPPWIVAYGAAEPTGRLVLHEDGSVESVGALALNPQLRPSSSRVSVPPR